MLEHIARCQPLGLNSGGASTSESSPKSRLKTGGGEGESGARVSDPVTIVSDWVRLGFGLTKRQDWFAAFTQFPVEGRQSLFAAKAGLARAGPTSNIVNMKYFM